MMLHLIVAGRLGPGYSLLRYYWKEKIQGYNSPKSKISVDI